MSRAKMEPTWRPGYVKPKPKPKPRTPRLATHADRFAMFADYQEEARTLLAASRLWSARDDFVDLLAARRDQLAAK